MQFRRDFGTLAPMPAVPTRTDAIRAARQDGLRVAAVLPVHYPRALLRAHGFHPMEVWGPPGVDPAVGNRHFQAYTCAVVRNATSFLLAGGVEVDAILVPHTCDATQGMASVLKDFVPPNAPVLTLYLPRGRRDSDLEYLIAELKRLGEELGRVSGHRPTDAELHDAIRREDAAAAAADALRLERGQVALSDRDFYALLRAREYLAPEAFLAAAAAAPRGPSPAKGTPLILSGIVPEPMEIFDEIAAMGARVVDDDFACLARRTYPVVDDDDPWRRLARALLAAPPEPTLGSPIPERVAHVRKKLQAAGARGLVVYGVKFCEPELFYLPLLRTGLEEAGLQVLHVEFDLARTLPAQTLTRVEAFVEMLR